MNQPQEINQLIEGFHKDINVLLVVLLFLIELGLKFTSKKEFTASVAYFLMTFGPWYRDDTAWNYENIQKY